MTVDLVDVTAECIRFQVSSESREGHWHLVDLEITTQQLCCDCEDHCLGGNARCKHMDRVAEYASDYLNKKRAGIAATTPAPISATGGRYA